MEMSILEELSNIALSSCITSCWVPEGAFVDTEWIREGWVNGVEGVAK